MYIRKKTRLFTFFTGLAQFHTSFFRIWPSALFRVWLFHVGFGSLPQKNCTIWTISKGYEVWLNSCSQLPLFYSQIVQLNQKTKTHKQRHGEAPSLFCYAHFYFNVIIHYFWRFEKFPIKSIIIHPPSGWFWFFGHSPNTTGYAQVRLLLACQPRIVYLLPVNGSRGSNRLNWSHSWSCFNWLAM